MKQLITMKKEYEIKGFHLQRLYCRRKPSEKTGKLTSSFSQIMEPFEE